MSEFDFLSTSWGIELNEKAKNELRTYANSLGKKDVEAYLLDSDTRKMLASYKLPTDIDKKKEAFKVPPGQYFVQVQKIVDITQPTKFQEEFEGGKWRLLKLDLTSGDQKFVGIEYGHVDKLGVHLPPGTKLLLWSTAQLALQIRNGQMLLTKDNTQVLGGNVDKLVESWTASRAVEESRLLWRTSGVRKKEKGEDGAPSWYDFDSKASQRNNRGQDRYTAEQAMAAQVAAERKAWEKDKQPPVGARPLEEDGAKGPRFQMEGSSEVVRSTATKSAFKVEEKTKGKGKGKGEERRKAREEEWEPEKRAPEKSTFSIGDMIKPTKDGALPDVAVEAKTKSSGAAAGESWGDDAWGADGWGDASWGASGWGDGWSGGSWGGGGGGGGGRSGGSKGSRKGGGGGKGGGKRGGGGGGGYRGGW
eukprot:TRINITY_DN3855_c0_g3_i1.p1 TRINITY_DN3855_c0_g3~~TRINITY_DN3855_c0_g3_i1.p1  ORF type:complete len:419 (-),score=145.59 TRINITY_DN3855_c0_g3_i1:35-1291(-)